MSEIEIENLKRYKGIEWPETVHYSIPMERALALLDEIERLEADLWQERLAHKAACDLLAEKRKSAAAWKLCAKNLRNDFIALCKAAKNELKDDPELLFRLFGDEP